MRERENAVWKSTNLSTPLEIKRLDSSSGIALPLYDEDTSILFLPSRGESIVRWMEISSIGEYHDHKGRWKGNGIEFEPLAYSIGGKQATEYLSVSFASPDQMTLRSVTETVDGKSILECAGERLKSK